jgi:hypothetical protein
MRAEELVNCMCMGPAEVLLQQTLRGIELTKMLCQLHC